jgi:glycosyltransferase involved in cell wall biosynthesis
MVITSVGGLEEFVKDGEVGYVVKPEPDQVANAIFRFYDEDMEKTFIFNVRKEKVRFSWASMLERIQQLVSH